MQRPLSVVLAGGGTAGHIEPAMAVADALREDDASTRITALGTLRGLETTLVPERGYELKLIRAVPFPRRLCADLFKVPRRLWESVRQARAIMDEVEADVLIGFGGYVSMSAYLAARLPGHRRIPYVVHEANARAGIANKIGARHAARILGAVPGSGIEAEQVGIPVRPTISGLDRQELRSTAREFFGLDPDAPVLLEFGGSQGAQSLNALMWSAREKLGDMGVGVLQAVGPKNFESDDPTIGGRSEEAVDTTTVGEKPARNCAPEGAPAYIQVPYISYMNYAYAAADFVVCRSGAMTVAEISAVGLPALYVPLPIGNGEQALNAQPVVDAGGGILVPDHDVTADILTQWVAELLANPAAYQDAVRGALRGGSRDAAATVARIARSVGQENPRPARLSRTKESRNG